MKKITFTILIALFLSGCEYFKKPLAPEPTPVPVVLERCEPNVLGPSTDLTNEASASAQAVSTTPEITIASDSAQPITLSIPAGWNSIQSGKYFITYPTAKNSAEKRGVTIIEFDQKNMLKTDEEFLALVSKTTEARKSTVDTFEHKKICKTEKDNQVYLYFEWNQNHPDQGPQEGATVIIPRENDGISLTLTPNY